MKMIQGEAKWKQLFDIWMKFSAPMGGGDIEGFKRAVKNAGFSILDANKLLRMTDDDLVKYKVYEHLHKEVKIEGGAVKND